MLILANTITADMGLIPGLAFVGPAMGLPLSVLAAFIERPFYTRAGVERQMIWYSLQSTRETNCAFFEDIRGDREEREGAKEDAKNILLFDSRKDYSSDSVFKQNNVEVNEERQFLCRTIRTSLASLSGLKNIHIALLRVLLRAFAASRSHLIYSRLSPRLRDQIEHRHSYG